MRLCALAACMILLFAELSPAMALPGPLLRGVELGADLQGALRACEAASRAAGGKTEVLLATRAQQYAEGLVRSGLLLMLNRAGARHTLLNEPARRRVAFVRASSERGTAVLGFAGGRLEAVLWRQGVTVDGAVGGEENPFSPARLAPLRQFLAALRGSCRLEPAGGDGRNTFIYKGRCGPAALYLEYQPERDEYRVLFYKP